VKTRWPSRNDSGSHDQQLRPCNLLLGFLVNIRSYCYYRRALSRCSFAPLFVNCHISILSALVLLHSRLSRADEKTIEKSRHILQAIHKRTSMLLKSTIGRMILERPS